MNKEFVNYRFVFVLLLGIMPLLPLSVCGQIATFVADKTTDCDILRVNLDATSSTGTGPLEYMWDFGNGNTISGTDKALVTAVYTSPGTYTIRLIVKDGNGVSSAVRSQSVKVLKGPTVNFSTTSTTFCAFHTFTLNELVTKGDGAVTGFFWNIEGRGSASGKSVSTFYEGEGVFDVALTVTDANNCNVTTKKDNYLTVRNKFKATIAADNTFTCGNSLLANFSNSSDMSQVSGNNLSYLWTFSDGTTSTLANPSKQFTGSGTYSVQLKIRDNTEGCEAGEFRRDLVSVGGRKPKLIIGLKYKKCSESTYEFVSNGNGMPPEITKTYDFGDGTISTRTDDYFLHTYSGPGTYYVRTRFEDPNNPSCSYSSIDTIVIPDGPQKIKATMNGACTIPASVRYSVDSVEGPLFYQWNFGDGNTSTEAEPTNIYTKAGDYTVSVKVFSNQGCEYNLSLRDSVVLGKPTAQFISDGTRVSSYPRGYDLFPIADTTSLGGGCIPFTVNFTNKSLGAGRGASYSWDFGDGTTLTGTSPQQQHIYTTEGVYSPTLTVTDNQGCTDSYQCNNCVRAGSPVATSITKTGPDTVCCTFDKTFEANVNLSDVDLLWYHVNSDDFPGGFDPVRKAYYKDSLGAWILDDQGKELIKFAPAWKGLHHNLTNLGKVGGDHADFYYSAYHNGCATNIDYPRYQVHHRPWGNFAAETTCEMIDSITKRHILNLNTLDGNWFTEPGRNLTKAVVRVDMGSQTPCSTPSVDYVFTPASLGFEIDNDAFTKIKTQGLFPTLQLPACFLPPAYIMLTTYLYEDDNPIANTPGRCVCDDQVVIVILPTESLRAKIKTSVKTGCAPLKVTFELTNATDSISWLFENGLVLQGNKIEHTFNTPGKYRFRVNTPQVCSDTAQWDSIEVRGISAHITADRTSVCMNTGSQNLDSKTLTFTDASINSGSIASRTWSFSNGTSITNNVPNISKTFTLADVPSDQRTGSWAWLKITDNEGCSATDSVHFYLRTLKSSLTAIHKQGCLDSMYIIPNLPTFGQFPTFQGSLFCGSNAPGFDSKSYDLYERARWPLLLSDGYSYNIKLQAESDSLGACLSEVVDTTIVSKYEELKPGFRILSAHVFNCLPAFLEVEDTTKPWKGASIIRTNWQITSLTNNTSIYGTGKLPGKFALTDTGYYSIKIATLTSDSCERSLVVDSAVYIRGQLGTIKPLPDTVCIGKQINFEGKSNNAKTYFWDFGDGSIDQNLKASHSYAVSGIRVVAFVLTDTSGECKMAIKDSIYIKAGPQFSFGNDTLLCKGDTLQLSAPIDIDYRYLWNTGEKVNHKMIRSAGEYILKVDNVKLGCSLSDTLAVKYHELVGDPLRMPDSICVGNSFTLQAFPLAGVRQYIWTARGKNIGNRNSVTIKADSIFSVQLFLKDSLGCTLRDSINLPVYNDPNVSITGRDVCPGETELLVGSSTNHRSEWTHSWTKDGAIVPDQTTATLVIDDIGSYQYTYGTPTCKDSAQLDIAFFPLPLFSLGQDTYFCADDSVKIAPDKQQTTYSYHWNTGASQALIYAKTIGNYSLTVTDTITRCHAHDTILVNYFPIGDILDPVDSICIDNTITIKAKDNENIATWKWMHDDVTLSTKDEVSIKTAYNYTLKLIVSDKHNCPATDSITLAVYAAPMVSLEGSDFCPGYNTTIEAKVALMRTRWNIHWYSENGSLPNEAFQYTTNEPSTYRIQYGEPNCLDSASVTVNYNPIPDPNTNLEQVIFCEEQGSVLLDGGISDFYKWDLPGEDSRYITVTAPGVYSLQLENTYGCIVRDSIIVENKCAPRVFAPDAFSPDGDGANDVFTTFAYNLGSYEILIFNRWGEVIFRGTDIDQPWDGTYRDQPMPSGSYPWIITFTGQHSDYSSEKKMNGSVTLLR